MTKIVITTGGTGGHIFPALATANYLIKHGCKIALLTDKRGVKWSNDNIPLYNVPSSKVLGNSPIGKIKAVLQIVYGFFIARRHLKKLKPNGIVGFGGYASFPVVLAGRWLNIPIVLHEQNAYAGTANRILSKFAKVVATAFPKTLALSAQTIHTGNPIRDEIKQLYQHQYPKFTKQLNILVTGGSQGAEIFGQVIPPTLLKYKDIITITQQVRPDQLKTVTDFYQKNQIKADVRSFIDNMPKVLKSTHLAICRSGAGTVMENACVGIPTIYIPYKYAINNHQYYNAQAIADVGGAKVIKQDEFTQESLQNVLDSIILKNNLAKMSAAAKSFATENAEEKLAKTILKYFEEII